MNFSGKLCVLIIIAILSSTITNFFGFTASAASTTLPVISRDVPAFASSDYPSNANDSTYSSVWRGTAPGWIAYDLSKVPVEQRSNIVAVWYNNDTYDYDPTIKNTWSYGCPKAYTIEGNPAPGGSSAPTSGWVTLTTVTNNLHHSRQHSLDFSGYNWLRLNVTQVNGTSGNGININLDVHDASQGIQDDWIFYGDSITAGGMVVNGSGDGTFAQMVNTLKPSCFPIAENGGTGSIFSTDGAKYIDKWLGMFPGKYVAIAFGTNDSWGNQTGASKYYTNTETMVKAVLAAGKIPVVPKIPYSKLNDIKNYAPSYNEQIDALYKAYPQIIKGPDFWTFFQNNSSYIGSDNVHPSTEGYNAMRKQWAKTMVDAVYNDVPPVTPIPAGYKISGYISPDFTLIPGSDVLSGFTVEIPGTAFSAVTDKAGYFEISSIPVNSAGYTIKISKTDYLSREIKNVKVAGNVQLNSSNDPIALWVGDVDNNNSINLGDIMEIAGAFNSSDGDGRYIKEYDLNKDNAINISDIMIVVKHFNSVSLSYPEI